MFQFMRGILDRKDSKFAVLDVSGIGYKLDIPPNSDKKLPPIGSEIKFYTHQMLRDNQFKIYAFRSRDELTLFDLSIGVKGIGPALAMNVVARLTPIEFQRAVREADHATLMRVPRVNREVAQLIIMTLRKKIGKVEFDEKATPDDSLASPGTIDEGAVKALIGLGLGEAVAESSVLEAQRILGGNSKMEDIVKLALRYVSKFS